MVGLLVLAVLVLFIVLATANNDDSSSGARSAASALQVMQPSVTQLAPDGEITIPAGSIQSFEWNVTPQQAQCHVTGHIEVTDGGAKDVQVVVLAKDDYQNFVNGHEAHAYFQTDKTTAVTLDARTGQASPMVLAVSNGFSTVTVKKVRLTGLRATCT
ncbi:MAG: hypothetical protein ACJ8AK_03655 [Gemmatimonadaceae bacterium]